MSPAPAAPRAPARPFLGGWHPLVAIVALAATRGLWAPDEPRYAQVAREAFEGGNPLVLHLCGDLYPDKPPLVYWAAGLLGSWTGWSELALRLPSILATAGSAWIAARIARRLFGAVAAAWTPLVFLSMALVLWIGARLQLDPTLSFLVLAAVDQLWTEDEDARARTRSALVAGLCAGLAALAKGPVAWLHIGLALVAVRVAPRSVRGRIALPARAWVGFALLAVLPVALWATAASLADPRLWRPLFLGQHLGRAADPDAPHSGPFWEHAVELPAYLLPWTLLVLSGLAAAWRAWRAARRGAPAADAGLVRVALWFVLVFAVFSAIPPKREVYLLPVYPVLAWLAAVALQRGLERGRLAAWVGAGTPALLVLLGLGAAIAPWFVAEAQPYAPSGLPIAAAFLLGGVAALGFLRKGDLARWADAVGVTITVAALCAALLVAPRVDDVKSAREFALSIAARPERPERILCVGVRPEGYRFYGGIPTVRAVREDLEPALEREGSRMLALLSEREWQGLPAELRARLEARDRRQVGRRDIYLVGPALR